MWGGVPGSSLVAPSSLGPRGIAKALASGERKSGQLTTGGRGCGGRLEDPKPQVSEERSLPRSCWIIPHRRQHPQFSSPRWQES